MRPGVALVASVLATSATLVGQRVQAPQDARPENVEASGRIERPSRHGLCSGTDPGP